MTDGEILDILDNANDGHYCSFVSLGHAYSYFIDSRLNVFCDESRWAIAIERLGYNPRGGTITLEIYYFGNCLVNLDSYNERPTNYYILSPIDDEQFFNTTDGEALKADAVFWLVRGQQVLLCHNKTDYHASGIELKEYEPGEIRIEEAARLMIKKNRGVFRATDQELYKSIPPNLPKILVLDEWYHKDFVPQNKAPMSEEEIRQTYDFNKGLTGVGGLDFEQLKQMIRLQEASNAEWDKEQWDNRPSCYETWQQIAKVIVTQNKGFYKPTLKPNSHWKNWPESGSL